MANYIQAIKTKLTGQRNIEIADLENCSHHPTFGSKGINKGLLILEKKLKFKDFLMLMKYFGYLLELIFKKMDWLLVGDGSKRTLNRR